MIQQAGGMDTNALIQRLRRLAMLDTSVFDEVKGDAASTIPAVLVAVVSTLNYVLWIPRQIYAWSTRHFSSLNSFQKNNSTPVPLVRVINNLFCCACR